MKKHDKPHDVVQEEKFRWQVLQPSRPVEDIAVPDDYTMRDSRPMSTLRPERRLLEEYTGHAQALSTNRLGNMIALGTCFEPEGCSTIDRRDCASLLHAILMYGPTILRGIRDTRDNHGSFHHTCFSSS